MFTLIFFSQSRGDVKGNKSTKFLRLSNNSPKQIRGLGYVSGTQDPPNRTGVVIHESSKIAPGLNVYCSAHAPVAIMLDNKGREVHRWKLPWKKAFPSLNKRPKKTGINRWRDFYLYPDGDLLALYSDLGLVKINRNSERQWSFLTRGHHDMWVGSSKIYLISRREKKITDINPSEKVIVDYITVLNHNGEKLKEYSIVDAIKNSKYEATLNSLDKTRGDLFHTNSIEVIRGKQARAFRQPPGQYALLSMKHTDQILLMDLKNETIVWNMSGFFDRQHDARLMNNGNILVFDNTGFRDRTRILGFDPLTQKLAWQYPDHPTSDFHSNCCGTNQRLPNGNTLVTLTELGRAVEITEDGEIVWEFFSSHGANPEERNRETVAMLFELERFPFRYFKNWDKVQE